MPLTKLRKAPGVYVEEIPLFPPSVAPVETAIPVFIGYTHNTKKLEDDDLVNKPIRITSMLEFDNCFTPEDPNTGLKAIPTEKGIKVYLEGSTDKYTINAKIDDPSKFILRYAMQLFFANGGSDCYVVSVGTPGVGAPDITKLKDALPFIAKEDEPTIIVCPEAVLSGNQQTFISDALAQCNELQDRVAIFDVPYEAGKKPKEDADKFRPDVPLDLDHAKYGAAYYPPLVTALTYPYDEEEVQVVDNRKDLSEEADAGEDTSTDGNTDSNGTSENTVDPEETADPSAGSSLKSLKQGKNDLYNAIKAKLNELYVTLPPSCAVAGVYARVDRDRGVWKAPANVSLSYVIEPVVKISDKEQEPLNVDVEAGKSVNAIRSFTGRGNLVWGARTLAGNDNEWRYVSVRRFFNFVEESVKKASYRFVFEPNNKNTWVKVKSMIENFLIVQWRAGALVGAKPEHAFFVKVGLNETMTAEDVLNGYMVVEIGMAVVRPAEFIILQFMHKMQES